MNELETGGTTAATKDDLQHTMRDAGAAVQERAEDLKVRAREAVGEARAAASEKTEHAKGQAADELSRTARGLSAAADELSDSPFQQDLFREAADGLRQVSEAVQGKSIGELAGSLSAFGRRNPVAFLGGAALAGFALARFARASAPSPAASDYQEAGRRSHYTPGTTYPAATNYPAGSTASGFASGSSPAPVMQTPSPAGSTNDV